MQIRNLQQVEGAPHPSPSYCCSNTLRVKQAARASSSANYIISLIIIIQRNLKHQLITVHHRLISEPLTKSLSFSRARYFYIVWDRMQQKSSAAETAGSVPLNYGNLAIDVSLKIPAEHDRTKPRTTNFLRASIRIFHVGASLVSKASH